jgi:hypothetical protein
MKTLRVLSATALLFVIGMNPCVGWWGPPVGAALAGVLGTLGVTLMM